MSTMNESVELALHKGQNNIKYYGDKPAHARGVVSLIKLAAVSAMFAAVAMWHGIGNNNHDTQNPKEYASQIVNQISGTVSNGVVRAGFQGSPSYDDVADSHELSLRLFKNGKSFMSLATMIEDLRTTVYYDVGGANIGMGYCITKQLSERGEEAVRDDMKKSHIPKDMIELLLGTRKEQKSASITVNQAVNLLDISTRMYERAASNWLGEDKFNNLTEMQRVSLTYLAYNVGIDNLQGFKKLKTAIIAGRDDQVAKHIVPYYKSEEGKWVRNERAGDILTDTWSNKLPKMKS